MTWSIKSEIYNTIICMIQKKDGHKLIIEALKKI